MPKDPNLNGNTAPSLSRRLAAILYDSLLLAGILFVATAIILPLNGGHAFNAGQYAYPGYLLIVSFFFFAWFWTHGGQTLGMRAWKIKLSTESGQNVNWLQSLVRFVAAILSWTTFGMGFVWILFDPKNNSWHDLASNTRLTRIFESGCRVSDPD